MHLECEGHKEGHGPVDSTLVLQRHEDRAIQITDVRADATAESVDSSESPLRPDNYVRWEKTSKAWITTVLFNQWLTNLRHECKATGTPTRVFIIFDNYSSDKVLPAGDAEVTTHVIHDINVVQVDNLWVIYLPRNATTLNQQLDQGIIVMVKAQYRAWFLRWLIDLNQRATA